MKTSRDRIIDNASYLLASILAGRLVTAVASVLVARYLGAEQYAVLSIALAFSVVAGYLANLGLGETMIREGTQPGADHSAVLGGLLRIQLALALGGSLLSALVAWAVYQDPQVRQVVLTVTLPVIWGQALGSVGTGYFVLTQRMGFNALIIVAGGLASAATLAAGILLRWPVELIAFAYGLAALVSAGLALFFLARFVRLTWRPYPALWRGLWTFTVSGYSNLLRPQLGPLIMGLSVELAQVGLFAAAFRIPTFLYHLVGGTMATAFYPQLFHLGARDRAAHFHLSIRQLRYLTLAGAAFAVPLALHSSWVMGTLFGPEWGAAGPALTLLAITVLLHCVAIPFADHLTTTGRQSSRAAVEVVAVVAGVAAFSFLGAALGATGGALAALIMQILIVGGLVGLTPRGLALLLGGLAPTLRSAGPATALSLALALLAPSGGWSLLATLLIWIGLVFGLEAEVRMETVKRLRRLAGGSAAGPG